LREPGLLLVHRLGHENARIVLVQFQQQRDVSAIIGINCS
jgi:hypothetical protein